ncbi:hypothetical protein V5799_007902 [Amblyomma americanum]|uniref:Fibrinogen C-terminal domain-containing protein n=1 Tax=Amblyomma americanum TaxID=6943 RepID=A0AAQ4FER0_AMBAM
MTLETPYTAFVCVLVTASALVLEKPGANSTYKRIESAAREVTRTLEDVKSIMFPRHCHDLLRAGQTTSGVYNLFHEAAGPSGQKAYCDMDTHGGGWTVSALKNKSHVIPPLIVSALCSCKK